MYRTEYVSPEGLRLDGRRPKEVRRVRCRLGVAPDADGSASFALGNTVAVARVRGPCDAATLPADSRPQQQQSIQPPQQIVVDFSVAPFSTRERRRRRARDRAAAEALAQALGCAALCELLPRGAGVHVCVEVLQADGGGRAAALNAAVLALADAGVPLRDVLCACCAGHIDGRALADLTYAEECAGGPDALVAVLPRSGRVALLQMDARVPGEVFKELLGLAVDACRAVHTEMAAALRGAVADSLAARGSLLAPS